MKLGQGRAISTPAFHNRIKPPLMRFSIITPSYNQGHFIVDCIESVSIQACECIEVEHIVADAGSTDETIEVLKRYPHLIWKSETDLGMSDGINKGFSQATGDWLLWLNCDDYLLPGALAKVADFIVNHPNTDVIHADCAYIDAVGNFLRRRHDTNVDELDLLFIACVIPSTSSFYRREIIDSGHLLNLDYKNSMDLEYYLRLMRLGYRFEYLPELLAHFRWHDESTTLKNWQRMLDEGLRCRDEHIKLRKLPDVCRWAIRSQFVKRLFQIRRVVKRMLIHHRIR